MGGGKEGLIDRSQVLTDYACATRSQLQQAIPHLQTSTARWRAARLWGQATCCARASARTYTHAHTQTRARAHAHCRSLPRPRPRLAHSCQGTAGEAGRGAPNRSLAGGVHCPPQPTVQVHSVPHKVTPTTASQNPPVASRQQSHQNVQGGLLPPPTVRSLCTKRHQAITTTPAIRTFQNTIPLSIGAKCRAWLQPSINPIKHQLIKIQQQQNTRSPKHHIPFFGEGAVSGHMIQHNSKIL